MQAPSLFDGFPFDAFPPLENGRSSSEVNVDRRQVVQALVIAPIVVVLDELADAQLELARQDNPPERCASSLGAVIRNLSPRTVRRLIETGGLPVHRLGRLLRIAIQISRRFSPRTAAAYLCCSVWAATP